MRPSVAVFKSLLLLALCVSLARPLSAAEPAMPPPTPPVDLIALDTMVRHHEATKTMARATEAQAPNKKLRVFAARHAREAEAALARLKTWRKQWYPRAVRAIDADAPGMTELQRGLTLFAEVPPDRLESEFLDKMQRHLDNGVRLAARMQKRARRAELKMFAREMAAQARREQAEVRQWRQALARRVADAATGATTGSFTTHTPAVLAVAR